MPTEQEEEKEKEPLGVLVIGLITMVVVLIVAWSWIFVGVAPKVASCTISGGNYSILYHGCYDTNGKYIRMKNDKTKN